MSESKDNDTVESAVKSNLNDVEDDDLEDGEIDDSDDDNVNANNNECDDEVILLDNAETEKSEQQQDKSTNIKKGDVVETIDLSSDNASPPSPLAQSSKTQQIKTSKRSMHVEDDYASSIENALANVLKKKGIEPTLPKVLENRLQQQSQDSGGGNGGNGENANDDIGEGQSRNSRRRKRKKQREDKEQRDNEKTSNKDKKTAHAVVPAVTLDNDDVDDYEMLNVRGGSPPSTTNIPLIQTANSNFYENDNDDYHSEDDSEESSEDSYNSTDEDNANDKRRRRRQKKDTRKRKERRNRDDDTSLRRQEKRPRRDSLDEKHRNEPRKLELCKFYLMECCAKKEKCSYMHSDFPCKYYYLGMDCTYKDDCKFAHSEPLSEELRNILLKHLETAPKEILGNFKRVSRETAISMITKRHEELCIKYKVQNVWLPFTANSLTQHRRSNIGSNKGSNDSQHHQSQQSTNIAPTTTTTNNIPSLLDLVIKPPSNMELSRSSNSNSSSGNHSSNNSSSNSHSGSSSGSEKQRKSRWTDSANVNTVTPTTPSIQPPSRTAPNYLDLKNLIGILSNEHIQKLSSMGISNLEQVNQLTFGQLNQIGLTIAEISEIQVKAMNMGKIGKNNATIIGTTGTTITNTTTVISGATSTGDLHYIEEQMSNPAESNGSSSLIDSIAAPSTNTNGDVDMRFLPSITEASHILPLMETTTSAHNSCTNVPDIAITSKTTKTTTTSKRAQKNATSSKNSLSSEKDNNSNSDSSNSGGVVMVDYTQYLKDSHISFDRSDMYDDERDEEQLVIDDPNIDHEENLTHHNSTSNVPRHAEERKISESLNQAFGSKFQQLTDMGKTLQNPFNNLSAYFDNDTKKKASDSLKGGSVKAGYDLLTSMDNEDEKLYYLNSKLPSEKDSRGSHSRSGSRSRSRSPSRTPPPRSQSSTPEASQSPKPFDQMHLESKEILYDRPSMYDYSARIAEEDEAKAAQRLKTDKDMRFLPGSESTSGLSDIDLRLPFQPITNYTPATEIDGSITSHLPMLYKVYEIDVPRASYLELRQHFKSDHTSDPRLRRILGLPELLPTKTTVALSRKVRKSSYSSSIASPSESEDASPKYYTPPSNTTAVPVSTNAGSTLTQNTHGDPRRNTSSNNWTGGSSDPRRNASRVNRTNSPNCSNNTAGTLNDATVQNSSGGQKQNIEIRNLLQKSEWYKNLNSKFKIMVNQQLALVSTELKKFHQDSSPNKIFDISFIVNNSTLQQILTNLGIYIDDNGEVAYVENEGEGNGNRAVPSVNNPVGGSASTLNNNINLPNLSRPPPNGTNSAVATNAGSCAVGGIGSGNNNQTLEFLRAPPPNLVGSVPSSIPLGPLYQRSPALQVPIFGRPSLLGLPPPSHFNPFAANIAELNVSSNANFLGSNAAANLLGAAFANLPAALQHQQRHFNTPRNQRNRRLI